jgi:hypothetical protein
MKSKKSEADVLLNALLLWIMFRQRNSSMFSWNKASKPLLDLLPNVFCRWAQWTGGGAGICPPPPLDFCKEHKNGSKQADKPNSNLKHLKFSAR